MATIKSATLNAMAFAGDVLGPDRTRGMRLEEIESGTENGRDVWHVTLSMISPQESDDLAAAAAAQLSFFGLQKREYKSFTVVKDTGEVTSMKIRELSNA